VNRNKDGDTVELVFKETYLNEIILLRCDCICKPGTENCIIDDRLTNLPFLRLKIVGITVLLRILQATEMTNIGSIIRAIDCPTRSILMYVRWFPGRILLLSPD